MSFFLLMLLKIFKAAPYHSGVGYNLTNKFTMRRLLLKILLYFFLSNYALIGASYSNALTNVGQTKALQGARELIELGKYEEADAIIVVQLKDKPRDA